MITVYITKFEEHLLKSWIPYDTLNHQHYFGVHHMDSRKIVVDEQTIKDILYFLDHADFNYNGECSGFKEKLKKVIQDERDKI